MKYEDALPIEEWVRAARVHAAECVGWFAPALYAAPLHLSDALPAPAAIDRYGRVYFNPQWVARLYEACGHDRHALVRQLAQVWYHEVAHWLREHEARANALHADARLWNLAADMEINDYLPDEMAYPSLGGEPLAVLPRRYTLPDGEIAEWYYQRLVERAQQVQLATGTIVGVAPTRNRRIYRIETHSPFGGKPAIALNLRLLQVEFHPFVELPKGLPFAAD
jgi:hypothetical protein